MSADFCVCCGATVPEGRQTCLECERAASKKESLYDDVSDWLSDEYGFCHNGFTLDTDKET